MSYQIVCDDVLAWAAGYEGEKFMACLCDPPYSLGDGKRGFMNKVWDTDIAFQPETWAAIADHLYPGAFLMAFGGSRTFHRVAVAMEDAGLILHPTLVHLQAQGFPKASRIDTAIDKAAGAEREEIWYKRNGGPGGNSEHIGQISSERPSGLGMTTAPATPLAATWAGHRYGLQTLKPCAEFILCAQKPYSGRPVDSIVATGAGALNIDGARVATGDNLNGGCYANDKNKAGGIYGKLDYECGEFKQPAGRWPPNVTLSHVSPHPCPACDGDGCQACGDGWLEGCRRVGVKRVRGITGTKSGKRHKGGKTTDYGYFAGTDQYGEPTGYADPDGLETVDDWLCVESCPVRELGEQSGERPMSGRHGESGSGHNTGLFGMGGKRQQTYWDTGTAARFYPNHSWEYEMNEPQLMKLRGDLTDKDRDFVMKELAKAGLLDSDNG